MPESSHSRKWIGQNLAVLAGLIAIVGIIWLGFTVSREMQVLRSAQSDNAQWSLAQTEVEFLDFANAVALGEEPPAALRRRFDIFYSRIQTIEIARVYKTLRDDVGFSDDLRRARAFLDAAVPIVDLSDADFIANLESLQGLVADARFTIRKLSNSGLTIFARNADAQRAAVVLTLGQLAVALAVFISALGWAILYLYKLNAGIAQREREQIAIATRMNTVIETSLDGVIVGDANGNLLEFSQAAEAIFGYTAAEVIGQNLANLIIPAHHRAAHNAGMAKAQETDEHKIVGNGRVRMEAMRKGGAIFPVEVSIQVARAGKDEIYVAFLRDVSNVVASEKELVAARDTALAGEKLKTNFLTTMSHEIRTPLNGILGNLSLLLDTKRTKSQDRYMQNMETSGRLLMNHITDVLDITRYDAGMLSLDIGPMNISILLQDIIDSQTAMAETSATSLHWAWRGPRRDWVMSDAERVQLIFMNLIGNAVKFTRRGQVTATMQIVDPDDPDSPLLISVQDTGPGIAPDLVKRIFDDFVTGNAAYDRDVGGTGLGLSIAKRFVTALGGTITVQSTLGIGSTFDVTLPMPAAAPPIVDDTPTTQTDTRKPLSILIVEDNEINRTITREMLEKAGHTVVEAADGHQGVSKAETTRFDLILMDISMPVLDGRAATQLIQSGDGLSASTPIVALTAHASLEDQEDFAQSGMVATLTKPLSRESLIRVLNEVGHKVQTIADTSTVEDSPAYTALRTRFVEEMDAFAKDLNTGDITLKAIRQRAHHAAGSAAAFQAEDVAAPLRALTTAASGADDAAIDAATADFNQAWEAGRSAFLAPAPTGS